MKLAKEDLEVTKENEETTVIEGNAQQLQKIGTKAIKTCIKFCDLIQDDYGEKITTDTILPFTMLIFNLARQNENLLDSVVSAFLTTPIIDAVCTSKDEELEDNLKNNFEAMGSLLDILKDAYDNSALKVGECEDEKN